MKNKKASLISSQTAIAIIGIAVIIIIAIFLVKLGILERIGIFLPKIDIGEQNGDNIDNEVDNIQNDKSCVLKYAIWTIPGVNDELAERAIEYQISELIVYGENCEGEEISFKIFEIDKFGDDPADKAPGNSFFNNNGIAKTSWDVEHNDIFGKSKYFFEAELIDKSQKIKSSILEVAKLED